MISLLPSLAVLITAGLAGAGAMALGLPLAWVLAPMFVSAAAAMSGLTMPEMRPGRRLGQLIVGSAIGLTMTPEATGHLFAWAPVMVMTAFVAVGITALLTVPFARLTGQSIATAFFSLTPGGLSEMANIGRVEGARTEIVALSQAVRVALLVTALPLLLRSFGEDGGVLTGAEHDALSFLNYLAVLLSSLAAVWLVRFIGASNPWMIGALLMAACLSGTGTIAGTAPDLPFALGQYLIGISIGTRFRRERMKGIFGVLGATGIMVILMSGLLAAYAWLLGCVSGLDLSTTILLSSPGGMAEMALTAKALHLNVILVTAFHFVRSFIVNAWVLHIYRLLRRSGVFDRLWQLSGGSRDGGGR